MGLMLAVATAILGVILAAAAKILTSECEAWAPRLTDWLIERAVRCLPSERQERMREEWHAFIRETPGNVVKVVRAWGLFRAAGLITLAQDYSIAERFFGRLFGVIAIAINAPLLIVLVIALTFERPAGPFFERGQKTIRRPGIRLLQFRLGSGPFSHLLLRQRDRGIGIDELLLYGWVFANGEVRFSWKEWRRVWLLMAGDMVQKGRKAWLTIKRPPRR